MVTNDTKYIPGFLPGSKEPDKAWILVFIDRKLVMVKRDDEYRIPKVHDIKSLNLELKDCVFVGGYDGCDAYGIRIEEMDVLTEEFVTVEVREITAVSKNPDLFLFVGTANHIIHWDNMNRYCGQCGGKTIIKGNERAKECSACGNVIYPRISPATITAVLKGKQILLAHNANFKKGLYSLIAGFVEPGETLEHCVEREIMEEVGIEVKNIKYFGSQPWSFPDSLMMAFIAEYESGDIKIDNVEITDAGWYTADELPDIPSIDSVAGKIIRWYRDNYSGIGDKL